VKATDPKKSDGCEPEEIKRGGDELWKEAPVIISVKGLRVSSGFSLPLTPPRGELYEKRIKKGRETKPKTGEKRRRRGSGGGPQLK